MDSDKRIQELEKQVAQLSNELRQLRELRASQEVAPSPTPGAEAASGGASQDPAQAEIDNQAWTVWLSRAAVIFMTVAVIMGAGKTVASTELEPGSKAAIAYGVAVMGLLVGAAFSDRRGLFANTALGVGLGAAYYATYAVFFVPRVRLLEEPWPGLPLLLLGLLGIAGVAYWRRSHIAAVMGYAVVFYTAAISARAPASPAEAFYPLAVAGFLPVSLLALHVRFHWRFLSWLVVAGVYAPFLLYLRRAPESFPFSPVVYFWLSFAALSLAFLSIGFSCVAEVRREDRRSRGILALAIVNSALYFPLVWAAIPRQYSDHTWMFSLAFTVVLGLLALFAETRGSRRNFLFQAYIAKAFAMGVVALFTLYSGAALWPALALACFALAVFYQQTGAVVLKAANIALMFIVTVGAAIATKAPGLAALDGLTVPASWLGAGGTACVFFFIALYYERATRRRPPRKRRRSGHWFLADSFLDPPSATVAMLHAALGALLLMGLTIMERGQEPDLPYLLGALSVVLAIAGFLAATPQLEVAAVLLLVASHVSFHFFLLVDKSGFEQREGYAYGAAILAAYTYFAGFLWERYLKRVGDDRAWEHNLVAPIPHLGASYMIVTLASDAFGPVYAPPAYAGIAVALLLCALFLPYPGVKVAGLALLTASAAVFSNLLYDSAARLPGDLGFLYYIVPYLALFAVCERLVHFCGKRPAVAHRLDDTLRTLIVAAGGALGLLALNKWADDRFLALYWLAHGLVGVALSLLFREPRYRWAAALILGLAVLQALFASQGGAAWVYQFAAFAGLGAAALVFSAFRDRKAKTAQHAHQNASEEGPSLDE
jgi:hypothetical protein